MSATLDAQKFCSYFDGAEAAYIQGRQFPVKVGLLLLPPGLGWAQLGWAGLGWAGLGWRLMCVGGYGDRPQVHVAGAQ